MNNRRRELPIALLLSTFVGALMLMILSVPEWVRFFRPNIVLLLLIFWLVRIPESLGVGFSWMVGFIYDGVVGGFLGQHSLSFSFIAYIVLVLHQRIRMSGALPQTLLVLFLLMLDQMIDSWVAMVALGDNYSFYFLVNIFIGALCWPIMSAWLNRYQRLFAYIP